jgi:single-strand DNA-binding protein
MYAKFVAVGRLTANPADNLRKINHGGEEVSVCNFTIACDADKADGETDFYECSVWRRQAETLAQYMEKGKLILVEGRPHVENWEKDGVKHSKTKYSITTIKFLDRGKGKDQATTDESVPF